MARTAIHLVDSAAGIGLCGSIYTNSRGLLCRGARTAKRHAGERQS
jgi:hypothetical protein